jgi:hypothetical protein
MVKFFPITRIPKVSVKNHLISHYGKFSYDKLQGVVDIGRKGNEYYIAYRFVSPHDDYKNEIQCLVVEAVEEGNLIFIKERWEEFAPKYYNCPKRILDMLTEPKTDLSAEWRKKCLESKKVENKTRKERETYQTIIKKGATIVFRKPVSFTDGKKYSKVKIVSVARNAVRGLKVKLNFNDLVEDIKAGKVKIHN